MTYTLGSLCTGFGGLDLAVESALGPAGHLWHAEYDPDPEVKDPLWKGRILAAHWPGVPNLGDLAAVDWTAVEPVDVLTAGFPCKDISAAGRQAGMGAGTRSGVWSHVAAAIAVLRPRLVVIENVRALLSTDARRTVNGTGGDVEPGPAGVGDGPTGHVLRAAGAVIGDLASIGFDTEWVTVPASAVGAPHRRERVFIIAWPADSEGVGQWHTRAQGRQGVAASAVGGGAGRDDLNLLLPTPAATLGRPCGFPSRETASARSRNPDRTFGLDDAVALLPTPTARDGDGRGEGSTDYWDRKRADGWDKGLPLGAAITLLPTPTATPYGNNQSSSPGAAVRPSLDSLATMELLPTPRATGGTKGGPNQRGSSGDLMLPSAVMPDRWGRYAAAIQRWEQVMGRPAPEPTETGTKGQPRLSPRFVEFLMGLPEGWVTDHVGRNPALHALGDGVVWQQGAYALRLLLNLAGSAAA